MYNPLEEMVAWANHPTDHRPVLYCEYAHAMGNSLGNFFEFWDAIRANKRFIGAFIWDWTDQGILQTDANGKKYWAYGGDFGDKINSGNFCINGVISADQKPKPVTWEVKKIQQPVEIREAMLSRGHVVVKNWHHFTDLSIYDISWELEENGEIIQSGALESLNTKPGEQDRITIPFTEPALKAGAKYYLKVIFKTKADNSWSKQGHVVAWEQFELPFKSASAPLADISSFSELKATDGNQSITIAGEGFEVSVSKASGLMNSYKLDGKEIMVAPLAPNFWRAPIDNDNGGGMPRRLGIWKDAGNKRTVKSVTMTEINDQAAKVDVEMTLDLVNSGLSITYTVFGNGEVVVDYDFTAGGGLPDLPRVGMQMQIADEYDLMKWFGPGPHETYWDRHMGSAVGIYEKSVNKDFYQYVRPQESNNHWGTQWAQLTNSSGKGIMISSKNALNFSAWPYTMDDLQTAKHINELPDRDLITVNIDHLQMGVGGDDSWSRNAQPHPEFRIPAQNYHYSFNIRPAGNSGQYQLPKF
jgi:beta-galactosidase